MGTGFAKKKKQARMMQDQLSKMQSAMKDVEVVGTAANGLVSITMNGDYEVRDLKIKPECVDPEDVEGLQDLIKTAFKDALDKVQKNTMSQMPGGGGGSFPNFSSLMSGNK